MNWYIWTLIECVDMDYIYMYGRYGPRSGSYGPYELWVAMDHNIMPAYIAHICVDIDTTRVYITAR